jgi:hypothetical protein
VEEEGRVEGEGRERGGRKGRERAMYVVFCKKGRDSRLEVLKKLIRTHRNIN